MPSKVHESLLRQKFDCHRVDATDYRLNYNEAALKGVIVEFTQDDPEFDPEFLKVRFRKEDGKTKYQCNHHHTGLLHGDCLHKYTEVKPEKRKEQVEQEEQEEEAIGENLNGANDASIGAEHELKGQEEGEEEGKQQKEAVRENLNGANDASIGAEH